MVSIPASERRKQVMLGELPQDFLCLGQPSTSSSEQQLAMDEMAARALQQQLNTAAGAVPQGVIAGQGFFAKNYTAILLGQRSQKVYGFKPPKREQLVPLAYAAGMYGGGFVPPNTRGRLSVTVNTAKLAKNYGLVRMDPYCRLRVGNTVFETPTDVSGGKSPKWNRTVHCYLPEGIETVFLELFDEGEGKEGMIQMTFAFAPVDAPPMTYIPVQPPQAVVLAPGAEGNQPQPANIQQQMPPAPQGPLFTEDDVKEIQEMFPNVDAEVITSVLEEKRGNKDAVVNALLSMTAD